MTIPGPDTDDATNLGGLPSTHEVEDFSKKVTEVSILVDGLRNGTISPAYVDSKLAQVKPQLSSSKDEPVASQAEDDDFACRRASVQRKVDEIKANLDKKQRARKRYEEHVKNSPPTVASTDYIKWDIWCPIDDEDELVATCTPESSQLRAMEKDINDRHARMVRDRQHAERCRKAGIEAYSNKQWAKAYMHFDEGCHAERSNPKLHSNAAMAAIKMGCYAQSIEHCEKVIRLHEFLLEKPEHPLVVKAWQRMAAARVGLKHFKEAAEAMEAALLLAPDDFDIIQGAQRAQRAYNEQKIVKDLAASKSAMKELQTIESLTCAVAAIDIGSISSCKAAVGVAALPTSAAQQHASEAHTSLVTSLCEDLRILLRGTDERRVYFRSCGGLQAVACLLSQCLGLWQACGSCGTDSGAPEACLSLCLRKIIIGCTQLLNEACQVDTNGHALSGCVIGEPAGQKQMVSEDLMCEAFLSKCCSAVSSFDALAVLLHTLTTDELSRQKVAAAFLLGDPALAHAAIDNAFDQLLTLKPVHQSVTVSLMSNCMTINVFAEKVSAALGAGKHVATFQALLRQESNALTCELAANLLANAAASPKIRGTLACEPVFQALAGHCSRLSESGASNAETQALKSCLSCLCNLGLVRAASELSDCLNSDLWMKTVTGLLTHDDTAVTQLAACVEARHAAAANADLAKLEDRLAQLLIGLAIEAGQATSIMPCKNQHQAGLRAWQRPLALKCIDAVIRILACLGAAGQTDALKTPAAMDLLAWACCATEIPDGCAGNAAICIGFVADDKYVISAVKDRNVVAGLVDMAYRRNGTPASKNAAITAAKLAQNPECLEQMRECHGFEKIHSYVKV